MPPAVVTRTLAVPAAPGGIVTVQTVAVHLADTTASPMLMMPPARFLPLIVTVFPPRRGPLAGETDVTTGRGGGGGW